jgi:hypothetical protein
MILNNLWDCSGLFRFRTNCKRKKIISALLILPDGATFTGLYDPQQTDQMFWNHKDYFSLNDYLVLQTSKGIFTWDQLN